MLGKEIINTFTFTQETGTRRQAWGRGFVLGRAILGKMNDYGFRRIRRYLMPVSSITTILANKRRFLRSSKKSWLVKATEETS